MKLEQVIYCLHALPTLSNPPFFPSPHSFTILSLLESVSGVLLALLPISLDSPLSQSWRNRRKDKKIWSTAHYCSPPKEKGGCFMRWILMPFHRAKIIPDRRTGVGVHIKYTQNGPTGTLQPMFEDGAKRKKRGRNGWERMVKGFQRAANCLPQSDKSTLFFLLFAFRIVGGIVCSKKNAFVQSELFFDGLPRGC